VQVESVLTPSSAPVVAGAMVAAYKAETGSDPPARSSWLIPVAQSALETLNWRAMWNWNPGNYTHGPKDSYDWFFIGHNALGEASHLQFRSYGSLGEGCRDLMRWLKSHGTIASADAGDVPGYVKSLQAGWYVGSDPAVYPKYQKAIASLVEQYKAVEPVPYTEPAARFSPAPFSGGPGAIATSSRRRGGGGLVVLGLFGLGLAAVAGGRRRRAGRP
jgi:hypothetical protein